MNAAKLFFRKYLFSSILILLIFLIVNIALILGVLLAARNSSATPDISISQIADGIHIDEQGMLSADDEIIEVLSKQNSWAMVLNDAGTVVWENEMPKNLPRQYTASDIAKFSRWYLDEYPVLVQVLPSGLLVIGYPPSSIVKLNYVTNTNIINLVVWGSILVITINILLVVMLFWHNTRKVENAVIPILHGIEAIAHGKAISLAEKGELAEINAELNSAGKHILKKDKARSDWINGVSHDIRTPLSIMLGYSGEIEDNPVLPKAIQEQAGIIRKQGEKLRRLIADLNLASKLEYSMQPLHVETIYPIELARQVVIEFLNSGLEDKYTIDFDFDSNTEAATIQGDRSLLMRMLNNLIQNSISHNLSGCHIVVTVQKTNESCEFWVSDDGVGLSDKQLERFNASSFSEAIYKADGETAHGFGLRLVQQIVKAHSGSIIYKNILGGGLSVKTFFPLNVY